MPTLGSLAANPMQLRKQNLLNNATQRGAANQAAYGAINANPQAFASWFGQQNPQTQQALMQPGGGGINTPYGRLGNEGKTIGALQAGGINGNALNQFINGVNPGGGQYGDPNARLWDYTSQGPDYGGSLAAGAGSGQGIGGWSGSDAYNKAHPFDPNAYTGQGAAIPQTSPTGPATGANGAGGGTNPAAPATTAQPNTLGSIANPNAPNYPLNVGAYLNPMADYMQQQALKNIQSTYAGAGNLQSGPAMKGIADYAENMALGNAYLPALGAAQQQQGFGYNVNNNDRNFAFQQQLANQTIPFQQQMQLAQLGLQGTQGQQGVSNLLATLLGQNAIAAGNAAGTGTIGGSNAISQAIQQMLSNYLGQNLLQNPPAWLSGRAQPNGG